MLSIFVVFATLKLSGAIMWSWGYVCIPLYYLFLEIGVIYGLYRFCKKIYDVKYIENRKKFPNFSDIENKLSDVNIDNVDVSIVDKINALKERLEKNQKNYCAAGNSNKIEKGYIYLSTLSLGVQLRVILSLFKK